MSARPPTAPASPWCRRTGARPARGTVRWRGPSYRPFADANELRDPVAEGLVTLVGPGGIGTSRLALELAHRLRARSGDDVAFVGLQGVDDHRLVAGAMPLDVALRYALDLDMPA